MLDLKKIVFKHFFKHWFLLQNPQHIESRITLQCMSPASKLISMSSADCDLFVKVKTKYFANQNPTSPVDEWDWLEPLDAAMASRASLQTRFLYFFLNFWFLVFNFNNSNIQNHRQHTPFWIGRVTFIAWDLVLVAWWQSNDAYKSFCTEIGEISNATQL